MSCGLGGMRKEPGQQGADITWVVKQRMNAGEMERLWWEEGEPQLLLGGVAPRCPPSKDRLVITCHHKLVITRSEPPPPIRLSQSQGRKVVWILTPVGSWGPEEFTTVASVQTH